MSIVKRLTDFWSANLEQNLKKISSLIGGFIIVIMLMLTDIGYTYFMIGVADWSLFFGKMMIALGILGAGLAAIIFQTDVNGYRLNHKEEATNVD